MDKKNEYDVVVVGAGIAGAPTALALSQAGLKTLVIEVNKHPRFAIGESTVPGTTLLFEQISRKWNIPELVDFTRYVQSEKCTPPLADFPKTHFWFGLHEEGKELKPANELTVETLEAPVGPDTHIIREKMDAYLVSLFPKYKVDYADLTILEKFRRDENKMCHLVLNSQETGEIRTVTCRFVVDATGHSAFFSKKFGFFEENAGELRTNTCGIYGHFKFDSMPDLDGVLGGPCPLYRFKRYAGTVHHCFHGGWIWVIPFDDGTVSVGLELDRNVFQLEQNIDAEKEFFSIINRFPTIKAHLGKLVSVRPFIYKPRLQIMSKSIIGDGVILTPHASVFVDALFSTGMLMTANFISKFVPLAQKAFKTKNFEMEQFRILETLFFKDIQHVDTLIAGNIESFRNIEVFKQYWKAWIAGAFYNVFYNFINEHDTNPKLHGLFGANNAVFAEDLQKMWAVLMEGKEKDQLQVARDLQNIIDKHLHWTKYHPYGSYMGQIGNEFPFKIYYKTILRKYMWDIAKYNIPKEDISPSTVRWRLYKNIIFKHIIHKILGIFRRVRPDPQRTHSFRSKTLPWFDSDLLK